MKSIIAKIVAWDEEISKALVRFRKNTFVNFFKALTESARGYAWAIYVLCLYFFNAFKFYLIPEQDLLLKAMFSPFLTWMLCNLIKRAVNRKRPYQHLSEFKALTHSPLNDSFPSLHAGSTFAFATFLFISGSVYGPFALLWAVAVSFSRLYLGVHYLSDLIAGAFLGSLCAFVMNILLSTKGLFS